jgi:hypothetical protein
LSSMVSVLSIDLKAGSWSASKKWYRITCKKERDRSPGFYARGGKARVLLYVFRDRCRLNLASNDGDLDENPSLQ